jgi:uncharacterized protein YgiM (DUF1202 family)
MSGFSAYLSQPTGVSKFNPPAAIPVPAKEASIKSPSQPPSIPNTHNENSQFEATSSQGSSAPHLALIDESTPEAKSVYDMLDFPFQVAELDQAQVDEMADYLGTSEVVARMYKTQMEGCSAEDTATVAKKDIKAVDAVRGRVFMAFKEPEKNASDLQRLQVILQEFGAQPEKITPQDQAVLQKYGLDLASDKSEILMKDLTGQTSKLDNLSRNSLLEDLGKISAFYAQDLQGPEMAYLQAVKKTMSEMGILEYLTAELSTLSAEGNKLKTEIADMQSDIVFIQDFLNRVNQKSDISPADLSRLESLGIQFKKGHFFMQGANGQEIKIDFGALKNILKGRIRSREIQIRNKENELSKVTQNLNQKIEETQIQAEKVDDALKEEDRNYHRLSPALQEKYHTEHEALQAKGQQLLAAAQEILKNAKDILAELTQFLGDLGNFMQEIAQLLADLELPETEGPDAQIHFNALLTKEAKPNSSSEDATVQAEKNYQQTQKANAAVEAQSQNHFSETRSRQMRRQEEYHQQRLQAFSGQNKIPVPLTPDISGH